MTQNLIIILLTFLSFSSFSQTKNDTIYYTTEWRETSLRKVITYYGIKDYDSTGRGIATYYRKNGILFSKENEFNNTKEGMSTWFHDNGIVKIEGNYSNNLPNGEFNYFNKSGQLESIKTYRNDTLVKRVFYDTITNTIIKEKEGITDFPDVEAGYIGGPSALQQYIATHVEYPIEAIMMNEQGRVYLSFIIEKDGSVSNVKIVKGVSKYLDEEAIRLVEEMPNWTPGEFEGDFVRTRCQIPINFTLDNGKKEKKGKRRQ